MLEWLGDHPDLGEVEELAFVGESVLRPGLDSYIHPLDEAVPGLGDVNSVDVELALLLAAASPNDQASLAENVESRQMLGHAERRVPGYQ